MLVAVALNDPASLVDADEVEQAPRRGVLDLEQPAAELVHGLFPLVVRLYLNSENFREGLN